MRNESFSILYRKFTFEHCLTKLNNLMRFYKFGQHWFKKTKENIPAIRIMNGGNLFPSFLKSLNPNLALKWTHNPIKIIGSCVYLFIQKTSPIRQQNWNLLAPLMDCFTISSKRVCFWIFNLKKKTFISECGRPQKCWPNLFLKYQ